MLPQSAMLSLIKHEMLPFHFHISKVIAMELKVKALGCVWATVISTVVAATRAIDTAALTSVIHFVALPHQVVWIAAPGVVAAVRGGVPATV